MGQGWNLISLPVVPGDNTLQSVLASVWDNVNSVWAYDPNPGWQRYVVNGPSFLNDLANMEQGKGYWVDMDSTVTLTITGETITNTSVALKQGWNLVGYNYQEVRDRDTALASIAGFCNSIWNYDSETGQWLRYVEGAPDFLNNLNELEPGRGYWIDVSQDCVWDIFP
jgi:hypothetical protein